LQEEKSLLKKMDALHEILMFNKELIQKSNTIIVGLSGGPDSVYLLHQLHIIKDEYNLTLIAAHLDHEWRKDSDKDVLFCKQLCEKLDITFVHGKASQLEHSFKYNGSKEELGRNLRRHFFESLKKEQKADSIALAHHEDDQLETFFIRLVRGTTISGITGIKEKDDLYIRPLLNCSKKEILDFLKTNSIQFLTDPTNESDEFLRNKIRNKLVPVFEDCDDRYKKNIIRFMHQAKETEQYLQKQTKELFEKLFINKEIDIVQLQKVSPFMQKRVISFWICKDAPKFTLTEKFIEEIIRFLLHTHNPSHKKTHQLNNQWALYKTLNKAFISK
jgi:tRNA(Ile)-lysidine synthase